MKLLRYSDHSKSIDMAEEFLNIIGSNTINESEKTEYETVLKKIISDLKINSQMVLTFGVGLDAMFPVVNRLISNMSLNIELTPETIVLDRKSVV